MKLTSVFSPLILRVSFALAAAAWVAVIVMSVCMSSNPSDDYGRRVVACGFPLGYCSWLAMTWLLATIALKTDRSLIVGPAKDLQLKLMQGPFVWFCNVAIVILPALTIVIAVLGMCGLLPDHHAATP
jgi:hypothetical protein